MLRRFVPAGRRALALTLPLALLATLLHAPPAAATPADGWDVAPQQEPSVPGVAAKPQPLPASRALGASSAPAVAVHWPAAGNAEVAVPAAGGTSPTRYGQAGGTPVSVGAATGRTGAAVPPGPARVRVEVLDRTAAARAGVDGLLLRVHRADGAAAPGRVSLRAGYQDFRHAFGGDWAGRLRLIRLPGCALTSPGEPPCRPEPLPSTNDPASQTVTAELEVAADPAAPGGPRHGRSETLVALVAGTDGTGGSFAATSLSPSATWQAGGGTGEFGWSYRLRTPPGLGGPAPQVQLSYSSGSVDGRISSANAQPSWLGEGFDYAPGFVERKYAACSEDAGLPTGDQCWGTDNAMVSLNGKASELVCCDPDGHWRLRNDDGSRVERLTGADNGDGGEPSAGTDPGDRGEYWKVTTPDGTQYFFGRDRLPGWSTGQPETNSAWTVPVVGDDSGEPCHGTVYTDSWCQQAYRWNLDHVVDPHGNVLVYYYGVETNRYGFALGDQWLPYTRGGQLDRIEYGLREGTEYSTVAPMRVVFTAADRCVTGPCWSGSPPSPVRANWPDTPWDQHCPAGTCPGRWAPSFWSSKRLASVTTEILRAGGYDPVDQWALTHIFPNPGDNTTAVLWLHQIVHTGKLGATDEVMPPVVLDGLPMDNRINTDGTGVVVRKWRVTTIRSESGGTTNVTYAPPECTVSNVATLKPESNTLRCMPVRWTPPGMSERLDWFHKYVVARVDESDQTGVAGGMTTVYEYVGTPAWHFDDDDGLVPVSRKTWSQWRGYSAVKTRTGTAADGRTLEYQLFYRGMDGDRRGLSGGTKTVQLTDSLGGQVVDHPRLQGQVYEAISYLGDTATVLGKRISPGWVSPPTATSERPWATVVAAFANVESVFTEGPIADGIRRARTVNHFDDATGLVLHVDDQGDIATSDDDQCTRITYAAPNQTRWIVGLPARVEEYALDCPSLPSGPDEVASEDVIISDTRTFYDGSGILGEAPDYGDPTRVEDLESWSASGRGYVAVSRTDHDGYGRLIASWDTAGEKSTMAYEPAADGPVTAVVQTNPLGWPTRTELEPGNGAPLVTVDPNGRRTELEYDGLGRLVRSWLPGRDPGLSPSSQFEYLVRSNAATTVTTRSLNHDGSTYTTAVELYDGLLRPRQTQLAAPGGGRTISDTYYNSRGQVVKQHAPYWNAAAPDGTVHIVSDAHVPAQVVTQYDGAGRRTAEINQAPNAAGTAVEEKWRTTAVYQGDRMGIIPPAGEMATQAVFDTRGRTIELHEYRERDLTSAHDTTTYSHNRKGEQTGITDAAGNEWTFEYDLRGRLVSTSDPDRGTTTSTFNAAGDLESVTNANQTMLFFAYDRLGRRTALHEGSLTGPVRASWSYDTLALGLPTSATRHVDGNAYVTAVTGYDAGYRPTGTSVTLPAAEGRLAGTYPTGLSYHPNGLPEKATVPAIGDLPAETISHGYTAQGLPDTLSSGLGTYVASTLYSPFAEPTKLTLGTTPKQATVNYSYLAGSRRLDSIRTTREGGLGDLAKSTYWYDHTGNVTRVRETGTGQATDTQCFSYDYLRRLSQAWTPGDGDCAQQPSDQAMGGPASYWTDWTYDATGNRKTQVRHNLPAGDETTTYTYPPDGDPKPHSLTSATIQDSTGTRTLDWGYDPTGNTISRPGSAGNQELTWDAEGHLATVEESGETTSYVYDANGNRLLRRDPTGTTAYLGSTELKATTVGGLAATRYYAHGGATVAVRTAAGLTWLVANDQGTPTLAIDAANTASVQRMRYTPFGEPRGAQPAWPDDKGFVGGTKDGTGLTHLGAREYDPSTGRFISVDPVLDQGEPQQMHGYTYAANNPTTWSDPSGLVHERDGGGGNGGTGSNGTADVPLPPDLQAMLDQARSILNKSLLGVILEAVGDILMELLGINDIKNCFTKGDIVACISIVANVVPWAKLVKLPKIIKAIERAWTAVQVFYEKVTWARKILAQVDEFKSAARRAAAAATEAREKALAAARQATERAAAAAKAARERAAAAVKNAADKVRRAADEAVGSCASASNSFTTGTTVLLADGSRKPIEDIEPGEQVQATDPETGQTEAQPVTTTIAGHGGKTLVKITVDTDDERDPTLTATNGHPFWQPEEGRWLTAVELDPGDALRAPDGSVVRVLAVTARHTTATVHNLTVADTHTYYVLAGETPVLVHNCGGIKVSPMAPDWATKGAHLHIADLEVSVSVSNGQLVGAPVRLSNGRVPTQKQIDKVLDCIQSCAKIRHDLLNKASSAMVEMAEHNWGNTRNRAMEMQNLIDFLA